MEGVGLGGGEAMNPKEVNPRKVLKVLVGHIQSLAKRWEDLNPEVRAERLQYLVEALTLLEREEFRKAKEEEEKRWVQIYECVHCKKHFMVLREEKVKRCPYCDFGGPLYEVGLAEVKELPSTAGKATLMERKMSMKPETKDWLRDNFVRLAREHKARCRKRDCNVQLSSLLVALNRLGIKVPKEEMEAFL
jgi:tRNA G26 N,N-dimethylase Trm1